MNKTYEQCYLGHHVSKGGYVLLPFVSSRMVEPFSSISEAEMGVGGLSIVLEHLRNPPRDAKTVSMFDEETKKRLLKIKKDHVLISLCLWRTVIFGSVMEKLDIVPLHATRGWGFENHKDEQRMDSLPITNDQFLEHLRIAFDIAS
jgi:hypothetical protein